jgi:hypothetical protein
MNRTRITSTNRAVKMVIPANWLPGARIALAALLGMGLIAHEAMGETVLFSDTFNVTANSTDVNFQNTNGRQSGGSLGVITYTGKGAAYNSQVGHSAGPNALMFFARNTNADSPKLSLDHDFIEYPSETSHGFIRFNIDPGQAGGTNITHNWVGLMLGTSFSKRNVHITNSDGVGILFWGNGDFAAFDGATAIGTGVYTTDTNELHAVNITITGPVDGNPWDGTNGTAITVFAEGKDTPFFRYTKPGIGYTTNYITLIGYGSDTNDYTCHEVDDLQIGYTTAVAANLSLQVDFQNTTSASVPETQAGFFDFNQLDAGSATYPTAAGPVTVALSGLDASLGGFYNRGGVMNSGSLTYAGIYNDFAFKNGNSPQSLTLSLSGPGILPRERYRLTFYAYDDDVNKGGDHSVSFSGTSGTTGSASPLIYTCGSDPTSNTAYAVTGFFKADASGQLTVQATDVFLNNAATSGIRLNAFKIAADFIPQSTKIMIY